MIRVIFPLIFRISRVERDLNMKRHLIEDLRSRLKANQENEKLDREAVETLEKKVLLYYSYLNQKKKKDSIWIAQIILPHQICSANLQLKE